MATKQRILIVDDEPKLCHILQKALTQEGYEVLTATRGEEALRLFKTRPIHLILLDLKMPGMDGLEVLKKLCNKNHRVSLPVIIMTAYGSVSSAREAMSLGVVDYLTKPFDLKELKSIIVSILGAHLNGKKRRLIYVPILHTKNDMGTLAGEMQDAYIQKFGEMKWQEHVEEINTMWKNIKRKILKLRLSYKKVKVYQDGLPVCGKEKAIVTELAEKGSFNHKLVQWMMGQGATLVGTEKPEFLIREYNHLKQIMTCKKQKEREKLIHEFEKEGQTLLTLRDKWMSERIHETLKPGETGILFVGLLHHVDELLPKDIKIHYIICRFPFRRSFETEISG